MSHPPRCLAPHPFVPAITCGLAAGHDRGEDPTDHQGRAYWSPAGDGPPTVRMPPITETLRRRPPAVDVRELRGPELLRALADELERDGLTVADLTEPEPPPSWFCRLCGRTVVQTGDRYDHATPWPHNDHPAEPMPGYLP